MSPSDLQWYSVNQIYTGLFRMGDYRGATYFDYGGAIDKGGVRPEISLSIGEFIETTN